MADACCIRLRFTIGNAKVIAPSMFMQVDGSGAPFIQLQDIANAARDAAASADLMGNWGEDTVLEGVQVQNMATVAPNPPQYPYGSLEPVSVAVDSTGARIVGDSSSGLSGGPQLSVVYSYQSTTPGPRGRGRMYLPAPPEADVNEDGRISSELASAVQTAITLTLVGAIEAADPNGVSGVLSRAHGAFYSPIANRVVHTIVRTQRRRALRS